MNVVKRFFIQLRAFAWTAFALVCISLALLVGVASLLLPYADRYRPEIESWLSERLGQPVSIRHVDAEWAAFGPRVYLEGLTVGRPEDENRLEVAMANVGLDFFSWIKPGRAGIQTFRLTVDQIELTRNEAGQWRLGGFAGPSGNVRSRGNPLSWLRGPSLIGFHVGTVILRDEANGRTLRLPGGDFRFNNHGDHQHITGRIGGPLDGRVRIAAQHTVETDQTDIYLEAKSLDLGRWLDQELTGLEVNDGDLAFRVWGELSPHSRDWHGEISVTDFEVEGDSDNAIQGTYRLSALQTGFTAWFEGTDRGLRLESLRVSRGGSSWQSEQLGLAISGDRQRLVADRLRIEDLVDALVIAPLLPLETRRRIAQIDPQGLAQNLDLQRWADADGPSLQGTVGLQGLSWLPSGNYPGVSTVDAQLRLHDGGADVTLAARNATVDFGERFRAPFDAVDFQVRGRAEWGGREPIVDLSDWRVAHLESEATGIARFVLNGGRPFADVSARISGGNVYDIRHYWPIRRLPERLVSWADTALLAGRVTDGAMVLFGDLDDWPFLEGQGRWQTQLQVRDATVAYRPEWPPMQNLQTQLRLNSIGLTADIEQATVAGVAVNTGTIDLPHYRQPVLAARGQGAADGNTLLDMLRSTPLKEKYAKAAEGLSVDGPTRVGLNLVLPLKPELGDRQVSGNVWLDRARVVDDKWDIVFEQTSGRVEYREFGFEAVDLETRFRGTPSRLTVRAGDFVDDPAMAAEGILSAQSNPEVLLSDFEPLMPLTAYISGAAPWEARISMPEAPDGQPRLELRCQLAGADIQLPAPLSKRSGPNMPFRISFDLAEPIDELQMTIGEIGTLSALRTPAGGWSGALHFGPGPPPVPSGLGVSVTGRVPHVDLDGWLELYNRLGLSIIPGGDRPVLREIDIAIERLTLAARQFDNLDLSAYQQDLYWYVDLQGPQVEGQLRLPAELDENRLMLAEFEYLEWPESDTDRQAPEANVDPRNYPPLDFYAAQLRFGQANLGSVRFESFPTQAGMRIDTFETESPQFNLTAAGEWLSTGMSRFNATLTAEDLGEALQGFGFSGMVEDGQLIARLNAEWPGAPSDFELSALSGELELSVGQGLITEIDPGAGRIFGLLSLQALPRRLLLDFSDLFSSGLAFDRITGRFQLREGNAHTSDLAIEGPTANVYIQGRTDLADRDYDQIITVVPKVGDALPLVGAIAGGGVGAAAVLLLQNVFSNQIDRMTQYHYSVTGPWDEPEIELIGANQSRLDMERLRQMKEG